MNFPKEKKGLIDSLLEEDGKSEGMQSILFYVYSATRELMFLFQVDVTMV